MERTGCERVGENLPETGGRKVKARIADELFDELDTPLRSWWSIRGFGLLFVLAFVLAASVEDFPAQLSYSLSASFADLARAFSSTDPDILTGSRGAFAEIGSGLARVQSGEIAGRTGGAFAQA